MKGRREERRGREREEGIRRREGAKKTSENHNILFKNEEDLSQPKGSI